MLNRRRDIGGIRGIGRIEVGSLLVSHVYVMIVLKMVRFVGNLLEHIDEVGRLGIGMVVNVRVAIYVHVHVAVMVEIGVVIIGIDEEIVVYAMMVGGERGEWRHRFVGIVGVVIVIGGGCR